MCLAIKYSEHQGMMCVHVDTGYTGFTGYTWDSWVIQNTQLGTSEMIMADVSKVTAPVYYSNKRNHDDNPGM